MGHKGYRDEGEKRTVHRTFSLISATQLACPMFQTVEVSDGSTEKPAEWEIHKELRGARNFSCRRESGQLKCSTK